MELLLAIGVVVVSVGALSLGLALRGRGPVTACEGMRCIGAECATCPHRLAREAAEGRHD
ncbi:hypothetical protein [Pseudooceanicola sp. LIPI14-2-Ac024]|uniref:hypothetical protein n=1 Tax=Pseudooceanicola sp. LIPI14-2-Ac024 TaxID=3344875 RepID=UPI0035D128E9